MTHKKSSDELARGTEQHTFDAIQKIYQSQSKAVPSSAIDKQILAAAYRELNAPVAKKAFQQSWWRRWLLPAYTAMIFTFTAIGAHWYWPEPVRVPPGTAPRPVAIDIIQNDAMDKSGALIESQKRRQQFQAPAPQALVSPPISPKTIQNLSNDALSQDIRAIEQKANGVEFSPNLNPEYINHKHLLSASNRDGAVVSGIANNVDNAEINPNDAAKTLTQSEILDRDNWVAKISKLLEKGDKDAVSQQIMAFKRHYPDYPIEAQLQQLLNK